MTTLPKFLRHLPTAFYVAAIIVWVFTIWSNWAAMPAATDFDQFDPDRAGQLAAIIKSDVFVRGFIDAAYMAANGAIVHVLIAIYDRLGLAREAAE